MRVAPVPVPAEIVFVETWPRRSPARIPAWIAARWIASSDRTIVPTVEGFACGPWRGTLPMTLYGAPTKIVELAFQTWVPPSETR